jgi:hypothetical protein
MLPKEFLEVRKIRGKIYPVFANEKDVKLAEKVLKIFITGKGKRYGIVKKALKSVENAGNFKKMRGFARIVERKCTFEIASKLNPEEVRFFLFERGYITSVSERKKVIEDAAKHFNTSIEEIEKTMFADREEEKKLSDFVEMDAIGLIKQYNLSLLQTALFNSLRMTFWTSSNHKEIFRRIKYLGLMYELFESNGKLLVEITGAAAIFKITRKYGVAMSKLIPSILKSRDWEIRAEVLDGNRTYFLEISSEKRNLFPEEEETITYDSLLEEKFARKIKAIKPEIEVLREYRVVKTGKYAFIPDFLLRKGNAEFYVEIVGFWTEEYLKKKIEKIKNAKVPVLVLAEDRGFEVENVIFMSKGKIPYAQVIKKINELLEVREGEEDRIEIDFRDVLNLKELSEEFGVSVQTLKKIVENREYIIAGNFAVKRNVLKNVKRDMDSLLPKNLVEAEKILEKYGLPHDILEKIGYRVVWRGISARDAEIVKVNAFYI